MSKNIKISLGLVAAAVVAVLAVALAGGDDSPAADPADNREDQVVRPDSQRLSTAMNCAGRNPSAASSGFSASITQLSSPFGISPSRLRSPSDSGTTGRA